MRASTYVLLRRPRELFGLGFDGLVQATALAMLQPDAAPSHLLRITCCRYAIPLLVRPPAACLRRPR